MVISRTVVDDIIIMVDLVIREDGELGTKIFADKNGDIVEVKRNRHFWFLKPTNGSKEVLWTKETINKVYKKVMRMFDEEIRGC